MEEKQQLIIRARTRIRIAEDSLAEAVKYLEQADAMPSMIEDLQSLAPDLQGMENALTMAIDSLKGAS